MDDKNADHLRLLLSPAAAAAALGMSRSSLYVRLADGTIPSVSIGRLRRIRLSDLEEYVDSLTSATLCK